MRFVIRETHPTRSIPVGFNGNSVWARLNIPLILYDMDVMDQCMIFENVVVSN